MKKNQAVNCFILFFAVVLSGCTTPSPVQVLSNHSINSDTLIYLSILDAVEQALSIGINGDDLHSHQLKIAERDGVYNPVAQSSRYAYMNSALCSSMQARDAWSNMECSALSAIDRARAPCQSSTRCGNFRLAPFVVHDKRLMAVVASAVSNPCNFIPDPEVLKRRHHSRDPRGPATMHSPDISRYWLSCGASNTIQGVMEPGETDDAFAIRWGKVAQ
jgi:hypothetical protein